MVPQAPRGDGRGMRLQDALVEEKADLRPSRFLRKKGSRRRPEGGSRRTEGIVGH